MCIDIRSDFYDPARPGLKPWKFGDRPLFRTQYNFTTKQVERVPVFDPAEYEQREDCRYPIELHWLNRKGGWDSFVFTFPHTWGHSISGGTRFTDNSNTARYTARGRVNQTVTVQSQHLPPIIQQAVSRIRESLQVYEYRPDTAERWLPVTIAEGDFPLYTDGDQLRQISFDMQYSKAITVQTV